MEGVETPKAEERERDWFWDRVSSWVRWKSPVNEGVRMATNVREHALSVMTGNAELNQGVHQQARVFRGR
eukprot:6472030-Amphidinium_carterae.1